MAIQSAGELLLVEAERGEEHPSSVRALLLLSRLECSIEVQVGAQWKDTWWALSHPYSRMHPRPLVVLLDLELVCEKMCNEVEPVLEAAGCDEELIQGEL